MYAPQALSELIEFIEVNRVSSTELADAFGKSGLLDGRLRAVKAGLRAVGPAFYVMGVGESNWHVHRLITDAPKRSVAVIEMSPETDRAILGELVAKYGILYRQLAGIVVLGNVRDTQEIIRQDYPIWAFGSNPIGCSNTPSDFDETQFAERCREINNSLIVADATGVVMVPARSVDLGLLESLSKLEDQESKWFDAIDRLKLSTFETVCLRKYESAVNQPEAEGPGV